MRGWGGGIRMNNLWCKLGEKWKLGEKRIFVRAKYLGYGGDKLRKCLFDSFYFPCEIRNEVICLDWGGVDEDRRIQMLQNGGSQLWCTLESPKELLHSVYEDQTSGFLS